MNSFDRIDDGDSIQPEERGGSEEMDVVGIDVLEPVLGGASEVKGIGGAEENRAGIVEEESFRSLINLRVQR